MLKKADRWFYIGLGVVLLVACLAAANIVWTTYCLYTLIVR